MTTITEFLNTCGFHVFEGYSQECPLQVDELIKLSETPHIRVLEIGFNAGHSADVFLRHNPTLSLTSFDVGMHKYVALAKHFIDTQYPTRHTLILGASTASLPTYIIENPSKTFDLIFIDGGHDYEVAKADLENCRKLAHKNTIVIMDDTMYTPGWEAEYTVGPTRAWVEQLTLGTIIGINRIDIKAGRGMSWGKYVFSE